MAEDKNGFLLYKDLIKTVQKLPLEKAGELFMHILKYVNDENPETDDLIIEIAFEPVKQKLKRDLKKYEETKEKNRENANKRWQKEKATEMNGIKKNATASDRMPNDAKHADTDTDTDTGSDTDTDILLEKETKGEIQEFPSEPNSEEDNFLKPPEQISKKVARKKVGGKKKYFTADDFKKKLLELEVEEKDADDWINVRRQKRAVFTENAIMLVQNECEKYSIEFKEAIQYAAKYGWQGFEYEWYLKKKNKENGQSVNNNSTTGNSEKTNTGSNSATGKVSATTAIARQLKKLSSGNSDSGNITIDVEIV
jgi:hypothetical protein